MARDIKLSGEKESSVLLDVGAVARMDTLRGRVHNEHRERSRCPFVGIPDNRTRWYRPPYLVIRAPQIPFQLR